MFASWLGWLAVHTNCVWSKLFDISYAQHFSRNDFYFAFLFARILYMFMSLSFILFVVSYFVRFARCSILFSYPWMCIKCAQMLSDRMKRAERPRIVFYVLCVVIWLLLQPVRLLRTFRICLFLYTYICMVEN